MSAVEIAKVWLLDAPYNIDRQYDYYIPPQMRDVLTRGSFVLVPFGNSNRSMQAVVCGFSEKSDFSVVKPIKSLIFDGIALNEELLGLAFFMKEHTFCTFGDAVKTIIPLSGLTTLKRIYYINEEYEPSSFTDISLSELYSYIKQKGKADEDKLKREFGADITELLSKLKASKLVCCELVCLEGKDRNREFLLRLAVDSETALKLAQGMKRSPKKLKLIQALTENACITVTDAKNTLGVKDEHIEAIIEKGIAVMEEYSPDEAVIGKGFENVLSEAQTAAFEKLQELYLCNEPKAALLYGITGSGKTRVIISLIDRVIEDGKSAVVLIPEIALTPQTVRLFGTYYGEKVVVWHSSLSSGEKIEAWRKMKNGKAKVCVGTRSAIFAPFSDIGLIVIDEEQEHTYKSDMTPKYHARDIARYRCAKNSALMLLASATPSVESYFKAKSGVYSLIELKERYGEAKLPKVVVADMRTDSSRGKVGAIGTVLKEEIEKNIQNGEQSVLFINRRGYNNFLNCPVCGEVLMCPHCSVTLTYHAPRGGKGGNLCCHYCGYTQQVPEKCPKCGNEHLKYIGFGTQKVEDEITDTIQDSSVVRMDADTTTQKEAYYRIIEGFRNNEGNILLGTQMVTKGHDFPNVTLVGVLLADMTLYLDDFHANERSFALITQVIGRAGRANRPGRAVIQTFNPEHPVLKYAMMQDYESFYNNEIALRRALMFPPFCDIFQIFLQSSFESELQETVCQFKEKLEEYLKESFSDVKLVVFGPFEAGVYKLNEKYRMRFVIKGKSNAGTRALFNALLCDFSDKAYKNINISIDINPTNI